MTATGNAEDAILNSTAMSGSRKEDKNMTIRYHY